MNISEKLASVFKGTAREIAEGVIDKNSIRILGQEIHEFENDIVESKQKLALIITQATQTEREISQTHTNIEAKELTIETLIQKEKEGLAIKVAEEVSVLESKEKQLKKHLVSLRTHEQTLKKSLKEMVASLDTYKNEYKMAKANENMQKAQSNLAQNSMSGSNRVSNIESSLERIKDKQQHNADTINAMQEVESSLGTQPNNAFKEPSTSAQDILKRIKEKTA